MKPNIMKAAIDFVISGATNPHLPLNVVYHPPSQQTSRRFIEQNKCNTQS